MKTLIQATLVTIAFAIASLLFLNAVAAPAPIKVAIIDTGLNLSDSRFQDHLCASGHKDFSGEGLTDYNGHGTHIAGLIQTYARNANYCLIIIKYWSKGLSNQRNETNFIDALQYALESGASVINLSVSGPDSNMRERWLLARYPKVQVLGAAGNDSSDNAHYPCGYDLPNLLCVGAVDAKGNIASYSNRGAWVGAWERGDMISTMPLQRTGLIVGTSQATAIRTGKTVYSLDAHRH